MTREEEIANYCEDMGFPLGSCSSINSINAITASDAIKWADKTMIDKACKWIEEYLFELGFPDDWLRVSPNIMNGEQRFRKAMEE